MLYWIEEDLATASLAEAMMCPEGTVVISVIHLKDYWNPPEVIYLTVKAILPLMTFRRRVVICCAGGVNRSNAIATTLLAFKHNISWDSAYARVKRCVWRANVTPELRESCVRALQLLHERLVKRCPKCGTPIEVWETYCSYCWYKNELPPEPEVASKLTNLFYKQKEKEEVPH